jgi:hypothetical protein
VHVCERPMLYCVLKKNEQRFLAMKIESGWASRCLVGNPRLAAILLDSGSCSTLVLLDRSLPSSTDNPRFWISFCDFYRLPTNKVKFFFYM